MRRIGCSSRSMGEGRDGAEEVDAGEGMRAEGKRAGSRMVVVGGSELEVDWSAVGIGKSLLL